MRLRPFACTLLGLGLSHGSVGCDMAPEPAQVTPLVSKLDEAIAALEFRDTCAAAALPTNVIRTVPALFGGTTQGAIADIGLSAARQVCAGLPNGAGSGATNRDYVVQFRPPVAAKYRFTVTLGADFKNAAGAATGGYFYAVASCGAAIDARCSAALEIPTGGTRSKSVALSQDSMLYLVVDGKNGGFGNFTVEVTLDPADGAAEFQDADFAVRAHPIRLAPKRSSAHTVRLAARHGCRFSTNNLNADLTDRTAVGVGLPHAPEDKTCSVSLSETHWKALMRKTFDAAVVTPHNLAVAQEGSIAGTAYYPPRAAVNPADPDDVNDPPADWPIFAAVFGTPMTYLQQRLDPIGGDLTVLDEARIDFRRHGANGIDDWPMRPATRVHPSLWAPEIDPDPTQVGADVGVPVAVTRDAFLAFSDLPEANEARTSRYLFEAKSFTSVFGAGGPRYLASSSCRERPDTYWQESARVGTVMENTGGRGAMLDSQTSPGLKDALLTCTAATCPAIPAGHRDPTNWSRQDANGVNVVRGSHRYELRDRGFERFCTANANEGLDPASFFPTSNDPNAARRARGVQIGADAFSCPAGHVARVRPLADRYWNMASDSHQAASRAHIAEAACFELDPRRNGAAIVMANSVNDVVGALGVDGLITDAWGEDLTAQGELDGLSGGIDLDDYTELQTKVMPWWHNGLLYYVMMLKTNGFKSPHQLVTPFTAQSFAAAFQSLTMRIRQELADGGAGRESLWMPNLNTSFSHLGHTGGAAQRTFAAWKTLVRRTMGPGYWDEKLDSGAVNVGVTRLATMLRLLAAREASTHYRPGVLSANYLGYQSGGGTGTPLESSIVHYLLAVDQPTIMLDLFPEGTNLSFENWLTLFGQVRGDRTLLQAILDVMPGAAVDTEPRATGFNPVAPRTWRDNAALVYRQYADAIVFKSMLPAGSGDSGSIYIELPNPGTKYFRFMVRASDGSPRLHTRLNDRDTAGKAWFWLEEYAGGEMIRVGAGQTILLFERQAVDLTRDPVAPPSEEMPPGDHNRSLDPGLAQPPAAQIVAAGRFTPGSTLNHAALTDDVNNDGRTDFDADGDGLSDMFDD